MSDDNNDSFDAAPDADKLKTYMALTQGELVKRLREIRDERRRMRELDKMLVADWRAAEAAMIAVLDTQGATKVSTDEGTASLTEDDVPMVKDWDAFLTECRMNDKMYLLQRRVATAAWRELKLNGFETPGIETYKKRTISLRKK